MTAASIAVLAAGLVAIGVSLALLLGFGFERFVGLRYLLRSRPSRAARVGLVISTLVTLVGLGALFGARNHVRDLETAGVVLALVGALGVMLFLLLRMLSVFTTVSTMGVVLGVASLVVVLAVTSGFEREFQDKVLAVNAHLIVMGYGDKSVSEAEKEADEYIAKLKGLPGLRHMAKFSMAAGEVMIGKVGANLKGVDLSSGIADLRRTLIAGNADDLGRPASCAAAAPGETPGRMIPGVELARRLRLKVGDCVPVLVPFSGGEVAERSSHWFKVVGIFQMGFYEYDTRLAYIGLDDARRLGSARQQLFGVELRFDDPARALTIEPELVRRLGPEARTMDWRTLNNNLFMALAMQKAIISLILAVIILVAAFNIIASLMLIVRSKVREIAILHSMGSRRMALVRIFLVAGGFVGFIGTSFGSVYGLLVVALASAYGYPLDPKVYLIGRLPVEISLQELLFVAACTQLICLLATIYPAVRAGRMKVVEGLRFG